MVQIETPAQPNVAALLSDMTDAAYFRVDADRNVVEVSPAMERLTGFSASDVLGRSCLRLHRCEECLKGCGVFDNLEVQDKSIQLYRADGTLIDVIKSGRVLLDRDGEIDGAVEVIRLSEPRSPQAADEHDEVRRIRDALERTRFNRTEAARRLGISRTSLWRKMREHGL